MSPTPTVGRREAPPGISPEQDKLILMSFDEMFRAAADGRGPKHIRALQERTAWLIRRARGQALRA